MIHVFAFLLCLSLCCAQKPFSYTRLSRENTTLLLVDHQAGLANGVLDMNQVEFKSNLLALAKIAKVFNLNVIVSTSRATGPNGPYLASVLAELPTTFQLIERQGEINAWDNAQFKAAALATGSTKFIVSGIVTEVCVAFVALSLVDEGYDVYAAVDSSGTYSPLVARAGIDRMIQAGVIPMTWFAIACELQRDWRTMETVEGFTNILKDHLPFYANLIESYNQQSNSTATAPPPAPAPVAVQPAPIPVQPVPIPGQPSPKVGKRGIF
jgi:nicotinamidase-related amidase